MGNALDMILVGCRLAGEGLSVRAGLQSFERVFGAVDPKSHKKTERER
jgi:hypothetical protein